MFEKVLIANRGEIAVRIARTLRELGVGVVAVFTDADRGSLHLRFADQAVALGADPRAYLDIEHLLAAARRTGATAVHPGYGFLSENPEFAAACERAGITFIGPSSASIAAMGNKQRARATMHAAGVPIVPGGPAETLEEARDSAARAGYPVLVKATDGGGGKGMRLVEHERDLEAALVRTRREALAAFGSAAVHIEKAIVRPRHVEIQILGDREGTLVHLFERDCSIQRRHQKVLEETPCPALASETLQRMTEVALAGARAIGYYSAGTFEFLLDADGNFYFLEANTRLQVEHPVTELVTSLDLVREMVLIAAGERIADTAPPRRGAAMEARIYAEDPSSGFLPSPGTITALVEPAGPGVRVDSGVEAGSVVSADYDPLLAKLTVWGATRAEAAARLARALGEYAVLGVTTNIGFLQRLSRDSEFLAGEYDTGFLARRADLMALGTLEDAARQDLVAALAALDVSAAPAAPEQSRMTPGAELSPWVLAERSRLR